MSAHDPRKYPFAGTSHFYDATENMRRILEHERLQRKKTAIENFLFKYAQVGDVLGFYQDGSVVLVPEVLLIGGEGFPQDIGRKLFHYLDHSAWDGDEKVELKGGKIE